MKKHFARLFAAWLIFAPAMAIAASGTLFMDTGGSASNSGTTDTNAATISGAGANWTTGLNAITLDVNTNISTVSGCAAGTCDGSQAIFLTNATNSNFKIFWLASYTGCTGTGACIITTTGVPAAPTCTVCTAQAWAIGGRMILTPANYEAGIRAGDTVLFNNSPASRSTTFITARVAGDATTGPVTYKGKSGQTIVFAETGNAIVLSDVSSGNVIFNNLQITTTATTATPVNSSVSGVIFSNLRVSSCSSLTTSTAAVVLATTANNKLLYSEITGCGGDAISANMNGHVIFGNYLHGNVGNGITSAAVTSTGAIANNIITGNTGKGISFSGAASIFISNTLIEHNTIYGNQSDGLNIASGAQGIILLNNIFQDNGQTSGYNVNWTGSADFTSLHNNNVYYQSGVGTPTGNLNNLTTNSTESITNPVFAAAGSNNFAVGNAGSAAATGAPASWLNGSTSSFPDIGAAQRQGGSGTSGGHLIGSPF